MYDTNLRKKISKLFGDKEVFSDISFQISAGERIGFVGTNGCGKSTLLSMLANQMEYDSGEIKLKTNVSVAYLPQEPEMNSPTLSGGELTRKALERVFAQNADILLLDEPTNNLDLSSIQEMIDKLNVFDGTVIVVSHDRYYLDKIVDKIFEMERGVLTEYSGNYTAYREKKKQLFEEQLHRYEDDKRIEKRLNQSIRNLKDWSAKAHRDSRKPDSSGLTMGVKEKKRAKAKKIDKAVKNKMIRLENMRVEQEKKPMPEKNVYFNIQTQNKHGRRILSAENLSKAFGSRILFQEANFSINRGEKVALMGSNGSGKTTLIRMLTNEENVDFGEIWMSPSYKPFLLRQDFCDLPSTVKTLDYLENLVERKLNGQDRKILFNAGIDANMLARQINTLSYGEKMKVKMIEPILQQIEFLILDEPTNHLDLPSREMLEKALNEYQGTLLVVSHDLYFLSSICDTVISIKDGTLKKHLYSVKEFLNREDHSSYFSNERQY